MLEMFRGRQRPPSKIDTGQTTGKEGRP